MKWAGWILGIAAFALMLYTCALPGDLAVGRDDAAGLAGTYTVNGVDPSGSEYSGTVVITSSTDDGGGGGGRYDLEWIVTGRIQAGTGELRGDEFVAEWSLVASAEGDRSGTSTYTLRPDGSLVGTWTVVGVEGSGTEEIFPEA